MNRRTAIRSIAITVWGMVLLPGCKPGESGDLLMDAYELDLDATQLKNLQALVDTFLPSTDTRGGLELGIDRFLDKILAHCYEADIRASFLDGLSRMEHDADALEKKSFFDLSRERREEVLLAMDDEERIEEKAFFDLAKELSVLAYINSEYYLTNFTNYEMVPGGFDGCVPVPNEPFKI